MRAPSQRLSLRAPTHHSPRVRGADTHIPDDQEDITDYLA